jgi:hypothetical protein
VARLARARRLTAAGEGRPGGSSTTNALPRGRQWVSQVTALPGCRASAASRMPAAVANRRSTTRLPLESSTASSGWWNQIEMPGRTRRSSPYSRLVSGSERGLGPASVAPVSRCQRQGKFRLRSTPFALPRVPAAEPSGFASGTIQTSAFGGGFARASSSAAAVPAHSLPWMQPTTSALRGLSKSPVSIAVIGRPSTDRLSRTVRRPTVSSAARPAPPEEQRQRAATRLAQRHTPTRFGDVATPRCGRRGRGTRCRRAVSPRQLRIR